MKVPFFFWKLVPVGLLALCNPAPDLVYVFSRLPLHWNLEWILLDSQNCPCNRYVDLDALQNALQAKIFLSRAGAGYKRGCCSGMFPLLYILNLQILIWPHLFFRKEPLHLPIREDFHTDPCRGF